MRNLLTTSRQWLRSGSALSLAAVLLALSAAPPPAEASGYKLTHAQAAQFLRYNGIGWSSSGNCSNRNNKRCTSFDQINSGTIEGIIRFKHESRLPVHITGGTETGHAGGTLSHGTGYKVDIRPTTAIDNYIKRKYRYIGKRSDGAAQYKSPNGNIYARESNHWDILYY